MYHEKKVNLVEELRKRGIKDRDVLDAIMNVDRHLFVPDSHKNYSYVDHALPIGEDQTISQPYTVAVMTELLAVQKGDKVLEVGTGSGYQAAILHGLGAQVYSVERNKLLFERVKTLLSEVNPAIQIYHGDGSLGLDEFAPYDKIIVTAGAPEIPASLKSQLKIGGKLVIPVGDTQHQKLTLLTKTEENRFEVKEIPGFVFVPLIGKEAWKTE